MGGQGPSPEVARMRAAIARLTGCNPQDESAPKHAHQRPAHTADAHPTVLDANACPHETHQAPDGENAFERLVGWANVRERSAAEMRRRLESEGFGAADAQEAVERAVRCGVIDDRRFTQTYIRSKVRAGWGRNKIERELRRFEVNPYCLPDYPHAYFDESNELERACALLRKKAIPAQNALPKFVRHLVGKGFDTDLAFRAARIRLDETLCDDECVQNMD